MYTVTINNKPSYQFDCMAYER